MFNYCLLMLAILLCLVSFTPALAQISFVQLTDPHIFDADQRLRGEELDEQTKQARVGETEATFVNALRTINEQVAAGARYQFVVITGDMGIAHWPKEPADAAAKMAEWLRPTQVGPFLFVPGNNDVGNHLESLDKYRDFISALKKALPGRIFDICNEPYVIGDAIFIGHNNADYRNEQARQLDDLVALSTRIKAWAARHIYLFVHIPEIDDPHLIEHKRPDHSLDYPYSAWGVKRAVRKAWHNIVADARVKAIFTGHFHANGRHYYQRPFRWMRSRYPQTVLAKTHLCPPLSAKYQWEVNERARGFQVITLDQQGHARALIYWYTQGRFVTTLRARHQTAKFSNPF